MGVHRPATQLRSLMSSELPTSHAVLHASVGPFCAHNTFASTSAINTPAVQLLGSMMQDSSQVTSAAPCWQASA